MLTYRLRIALFLCLACLVVAGPWRETTDFWTKQVGHFLPFNAYSGYEQIDWYHTRRTTGMYYELYSSYGTDLNTSSPDHPLFIYMNGGPGMSSMFGSHREMGPITITNNKISEADPALISLGHALFVDSTLNAGFSYGPGIDRLDPANLVKSSQKIAEHLANFLYNFYNTWPALKASPLYVFGESFAGHYVPNFISKILANSTAFGEIKVAGVGIGAGWIDPLNQIGNWDNYLWSVGVVERSYRGHMNWHQTRAMTYIYEGEFKKATDHIRQEMLNEDNWEKFFGKTSIHNYRREQGYEDIWFAEFLQNNKNEFGVPLGVDFIWFNHNFIDSLAEDFPKSTAREFVTLLRKVPVLFYQGQNDVIVNSGGTLQFLNSLHWEQIDSWKKEPKKLWSYHNEIRGWAKIQGNLWYVLINEAGHHAALDKPQATMNAIAKFAARDYDWRT